MGSVYRTTQASRAVLDNPGTIIHTENRTMNATAPHTACRPYAKAWWRFCAARHARTLREDDGVARAQHRAVADLERERRVLGWPRRRELALMHSSRNTTIEGSSWPNFWANFLAPFSPRCPPRTPAARPSGTYWPCGCIYEGALSFVTTICSSNRDSAYKTRTRMQNDRRPRAPPRPACGRGPRHTS